MLFSDAAGVRFRDIRHDLGRIVRLLAIGFAADGPRRVGAGEMALPRPRHLAPLLVGAALAPTDAALGLPVVTNPAVPSGIRKLITVESRLNDGIVTPVVMLALAGAASAEGAEGAPGLWAALPNWGSASSWAAASAS